MKVYLAGPIFGQSDEQAIAWRNAARTLLAPFAVEDPMARDFRGDERKSARRIVEGDTDAIGKCSALLVNAERPSWGTAMEVRMAFAMGLPVVAFTGSTAEISPWLSYHCELVVASLAEAAEYVVRRLSAVSG